jgi:peptidoglycan/xylan/chitin deacetylase (PgdA/CDA1 family)
MSEPAATRPLASVSLDLDDLWSYLKIRGDARWESRPSYLPLFIPRALDALDEADIRITFFIVGADAALDRNREALSKIIARGHEPGNHSFEHESWLHLYSREQLEDEVSKAEHAIVAATGARPIGFRGPGYSWSHTLLEVLSQRGYLYDASTLPTYLGPLARAYYFATAAKGMKKTAERSTLFGTFADGLRPIRPYRWRLGPDRTLLEIPVSTIPGVKTPFHLSYLLYLSRFSETLAITYLRTAITACRIAGVEPSYLLHPLDLLGGEEAPELAFFPGMDVSGKQKRAFFVKVMRVLGEHFQLVNMSTHARAILSRARLATRVPDAKSPVAVGG